MAKLLATKLEMAWAAKRPATGNELFTSRFSDPVISFNEPLPVPIFVILFNIHFSFKQKMWFSG